MPPVLLLKGDDKFYGKMKIESKGDPQGLERPPPPPNPMSNVKLTNDLQRKNAVDRITTDLKNPSDLKSREDPTIQAELDIKDTEKLKQTTDIGSTIKGFIDNPFGIDKEMEDEEGRTWRSHKKKGEKVKLAGIEDAGEIVQENLIRPAGTLVERGFDFLEGKALSLILLVGGIYIASQFASGLGSSVGKSKKSED